MNYPTRLLFVVLALNAVALPILAQTTDSSEHVATANVDDSGHPSPDHAPASYWTQGGPAEAVFFYLFGGALLISALGVCVTKSIVRMAVWLFFALFAVAVLYLLLGAFFLGAIQIIIYAGGTLILLVFGVMLTSKSPQVRFESSKSELLTAFIVSAVLFVGLFAVLSDADWPPEAVSVQQATVAEIGKELLTTYLVPFEVASVVLLVVMIGAAYLARQEK